MEIIELRNISFSYNSKTVISNVSHDYIKGSFTAVMGPNGSGKTTLIKLMNGLLKPDMGEIILNDNPLLKTKRELIAQKMAYVPQQQTNVFPSTVFDTVLLGRKPYISWNPKKRDKEIVSSVLLKLGLADIAFKDINQLSGGQRQRVFIARALAQEPQIILLDEPTANLDLQHQHQVMALLQELSNAGITIIIAIHDINLALKYCSQFMLLDNGILVANGAKQILTKNMIEKIYKVKVHMIEKEKETFVIPIKSL
jgi:iron complex transport system ATP-binding protein